MPAERLTMRKIREVFRLKFYCDVSNRQIAKSCNIALAPSLALVPITNSLTPNRFIG